VTDGQNYDSPDRASIAASRGKKTKKLEYCAAIKFLFKEGCTATVIHKCMVTV